MTSRVVGVEVGMEDDGGDAAGDEQDSDRPLRGEWRHTREKRRWRQRPDLELYMS